MPQRPSLLCRLVLLSLAAWSGIAGAADHCVILQYHHVSASTPRSTSVTPAEFEAHLAYLRDGPFQILPLQQVVRALKEHAALPDYCVSISFDDAYDSIFSDAFPRLQRLGWPFTVFISTEGVDRGLHNYMTWEQMRIMAAAGVRFENHSHTHAHLVRRLGGESDAQWEQRVREDLAHAGERIRSELGQVSELLAYPYGEHDPPLERLVARMGLVAFGQHSGPAWSGSRPQALPRFPLGASHAGMEGFADKVRSLPLPVVGEDPEDPLLPLHEWRPTLALRLTPGLVLPGALTCYVSGQQTAQIQWTDQGEDRLSVRARAPLAIGRNRYNCTAPSGRKGRFYWYSHAWLRRHGDGRWYQEP